MTPGSTETPGFPRHVATSRPSRQYMGSEIEVLVVGNFLLYKEEQDPAPKINHQDQFESD